ncbi:neuronal acetylcholine receptor subunit non-alpha-2-like [Convolutriloba macropyga]|uniref:neuronal acetylcholine receptor subunit non-alpha-2-like n=1 Tax=Convolutriloba macropyga TaxID=536237 RepID=UPI003F521B33
MHIAAGNLFMAAVVLICAVVSHCEQSEAEAEVNDHKRGRNEKIIIDQLTEFYPKYSPPFLSGLRSQDKYFVNFLQLVDVNEKEGWWKARIYFEISQKVWNNHIWGQYNESYQDWTLEVPAGMFWTPNPTILESTESKYDLRKTIIQVSIPNERFTNFVINPQISLLKLWCPFDVTFFPLDQQICSISISDGSHRHPRSSGKKINVRLHAGFENLSWDSRKGHDKDLECENDDWEVLAVLYQISTSRESSSTIFKLQITLRRKPLYYILVLVLPSITIYLLSTLSFLLPSDTCDKVSFAVTIFLAEIVTYSALTDFLPESSENIPILLYFLNIIMFHMGLLCLTSVVVVNLSQNSWRVWMGPRLKIFVTSKWLSLVGLRPLSDQDRYQHFAVTRHSQGNVLNRLGACTTISFKLQDEETKQQRLQKEAEKNEIRWKFFAIIVDRILLIIHTVITSSNLLIFALWFYAGYRRNN